MADFTEIFQSAHKKKAVDEVITDIPFDEHH